MKPKIKIAFDLDGVIVDKPPFIPKSWLERLFRGNVKNQLYCRFPRNKVEQIVRKLSHFYLLRPAIKENIALIDELSRNKQFEVFVVSGRYAFLKPETEKWLTKRKADRLFKAIFLNLNNEQPHLFKENILRKIKADIFVEDDREIASFLKQRLPHLKLICLPPDKKIEVSSIYS